MANQILTNRVIVYFVVLFFLVVRASNAQPSNIPTGDFLTQIESYTEEIQTSNYPKKDILFYKGDMIELLSNLNIYNHKIRAKITNPFDGQAIDLLVNPSFVTKNHVDTLEGADRLTTGSYYHEEDIAKPTTVLIHNTQKMQNNQDDEVFRNVVLDLNKNIVPNSIAFLKKDIKDAMNKIKSLDYMYTVYHELAHTYHSSFSKEELNKMVDKYKGIFIDKNNNADGELKTQIKESIADVSAILMMQHHSDVTKSDLILAIKGVTLRRLENSIWFEETDEYTRSIGDIGHNTVPALLTLLALYNDTDTLDRPIPSDKIIGFANNIVNQMIENKVMFLNKNELKNNIANDTTIERLIKKSPTYEAKDVSYRKYILEEKLITEQARNHEVRYLSNYYNTLDAQILNLVRGIN